MAENTSNNMTTVSETSGGTDGKQPSLIKSSESITDTRQQINQNGGQNFESPNFESATAIKGKGNQLSEISMTELFETAFPPRIPVVDGVLYSGTYLFVGAPKVGKSFFMAQLAYHVAVGLPLWDYPVHQGTVLYLALEDDYARLQHRLSCMFGVESTDNLYFAVQSKVLDKGLSEQLEEFVKHHADTRLIIIDTLQKIREVTGDKNSYFNDYEVVSKLKAFTDAHGNCLLVVHHTRKMEAEDSFELISGTQGLLGAADGAFVMQKKKRTDNIAVLDVVGRDQPDQELTVEFDRERCIWNFRKAELDLWKRPADPLLEAVANIFEEGMNEWSGSPSNLLEKLPDADIQANVLTRKLNVSADILFNDYGILYENKRTHSGREVKLQKIGGDKHYSGDFRQRDDM
ncbi:MAG: helicase RepA family protein [Lachnospiraceae bacterium]|nr:helicase RepA family protein [Lachnospiraceae bacterium]